MAEAEKALGSPGAAYRCAIHLFWIDLSTNCNSGVPLDYDRVKRFATCATCGRWCEAVAPNQNLAQTKGRWKVTPEELAHLIFRVAGRGQHEPRAEVGLVCVWSIWCFKPRQLAAKKPLTRNLWVPRPLRSPEIPSHHHFETIGNHGCLGIERGIIIPRFLR